MVNRSPADCHLGHWVDLTKDMQPRKQLSRVTLGIYQKGIDFLGFGWGYNESLSERHIKKLVCVTATLIVLQLRYKTVTPDNTIPNKK